MSFLNRLTGLFRSSRLDAELDDELRSHLEMRTEMNIAQGMSPEDARHDALRRFGNRGLVKEDTRRADILPWLESVAQDARYALRMFRKSPGFTAVTLLTLALGIGANTAIFTLTRAVLLRDLPVSHPEQLVRVTFAKPDQDFGLSGPMFDEIARRNQVYQSVFAWSGAFFDVSRNGEVRREYAAYASGNTFPTLGLRRALGRLLGPDDDRPGGGSNGWAAVLSYDTWRSQFHGDARVLGSTLTVEGATVTIVGVLPRDFTGVLVGSRPAFVLPLEFEPFLHAKSAMRHQAGALWLTVIGRLKPGMALPQARADIEHIGPAILHDTDTHGILSSGFFGGSKWGAESARAGRFYMRSRYEQPLLFLQALAGVILFICCANVAGLMLARSSARRHEFAIRAALGAGRLRMVRQLCVEGAMVALVGAASALAVSKLASGALVHALMRDTVTLDLAPDRGIFLFTLAVAVLATFVSSLPAALRASRLQPAGDLKLSGGGRTTRTRMETVLVTAELALSVVLLVAAGLLAGSLYRLLTTDTGFRTEGMLIVRTDFSKLSRNPEQQVALYREVLQRVAGLPNVQAASAEAIPLLTGWVSSTYAASTLPDGSLRGDDNLFYNTVGPNYFTTAGTSILAGRDVRDSDDGNSAQVCWLNRSAAEYFFPAGNAVGQYLNADKPGVESADKDKKPSICQVVGVVQDTKYTNLRAASPRMLYHSMWQYGPTYDQNMLLVRSDNVAAATAGVRHVLHEIVPAAPVLEATTVREQLRQSIGRELVTADLAIFFGLLALLLVAVGIYGLLSYEVLQKTREIGVRIALGATRRNVLRLVIGRAGLLTVAGLGLGLVVAYPLARLLEGLVFGVKPHDPVTFLVAAATLVLVALAASYLPARRATRVDPMEALRCE